MRVKKTFGERTPFFSQPQDEKVKYILAFEGQETEVQYFNGIINHQREIGVSSLIEIVPLFRGVLHESTSHPHRNLDFLNSHLQQFNTAKTIIEMMVDYCEERSCCGIYSLTELREILVQTFVELHPTTTLDANLENPKEVIETLAKRCVASNTLSKQVTKIVEYIKNQEIEYIPGYDKVCLIVDRDRNNFSKQQYEEVKQKCDESEMRLFVSNPTFEFWLLLHSDDVFEYNTSDLLENKKIVGGKRYLETILSKTFNGYRKEDIKFSEKFLPHIRSAINRGQHFSHEIGMLENKLGTNVGVLVDELLETV